MAADVFRRDTAPAILHKRRSALFRYLVVAGLPFVLGASQVSRTTPIAAGGSIRSCSLSTLNGGIISGSTREINGKVSAVAVYPDDGDASLYIQQMAMFFPPKEFVRAPPSPVALRNAIADNAKSVAAIQRVASKGLYAIVNPQGMFRCYGLLSGRYRLLAIVQRVRTSPIAGSRLTSSTEVVEYYQAEAVVPRASDTQKVLVPPGGFVIFARMPAGS